MKGTRELVEGSNARSVKWLGYQQVLMVSVVNCTEVSARMSAEQ